MGNQTNQDNQNNENASFYDQADGKFNKAIQNGQSDKLSKGVISDDEGASVDDEGSGSTYSKNLISDADAQVRETEDASLQDDTYSFDEDNTDNEEYHDADEVEDFDIDNDDDFVQ